MSDKNEDFWERLEQKQLNPKKPSPGQIKKMIEKVKQQGHLKPIHQDNHNIGKGPYFHAVRHDLLDGVIRHGYGFDYVPVEYNDEYIKINDPEMYEKYKTYMIDKMIDLSKKGIYLLNNHMEIGVKMFEWNVANEVMSHYKYHDILLKDIRLQYSKEEIHKAASKCMSMKCFKKYTMIYSDAIRKGILEEVTEHFLAFQKDKYKVPTILYYLEINSGMAYKIGITRLSVEERYSNTDMEKIRILKTVTYDTMGEAHKEEQRIIKKYKQYKYNGKNILQSCGITEMFSIDILGLSPN